MLNPIERSAENTDPEPATIASSAQSRVRLKDDPERIRRWTSAAALIAFALNLILAQLSINSARGGDTSAVQIIQVWTPHIYYAVLITGVAVALYIYSRGKEAER